MKKFVLALLLVGYTLSAPVLASSTQNTYLHTYWHIVNNTGAPLYISNPVIGGTWLTPIPAATAIPISPGEYNNTLTSLQLLFNAGEDGQADILVCADPQQYNGRVFCNGASDFCTLYTNLNSKYAPHYTASVNKQAGTLSCNVEKQVTPDGMSATFTINKN